MEKRLIVKEPYEKAHAVGAKPLPGNGLKYPIIASVMTTLLFAGLIAVIFVFVLTPSIGQGIAEDFSRMDEKYGHMMEQINEMKESLSQTRSEVDFLNEGLKRKEGQYRLLQSQIKEMNNSFEQVLLCLTGFNGIAYNGSCLWAEKAPANMTLDSALQTCNRKAPSKLPEIYGRQEYLKIMEYLRSKINKTVIQTWTGMKRNITTGKALLSDGSVAPYIKPRSMANQWSNAEAKRTHVYLNVLLDSSDTDNGMGSIWPSYGFTPNARVVLCQKL